MSRLFCPPCLLVAASWLLTLAAPAWADPEIAVLHAGDWVAVNLDGDRRGSAQDTLTDDARDAIERAPGWLQGAMRVRLQMLDDDLQDSLAAAVLDAEDPRWVDEIAFCVANITERDLSQAGFDPQLLVDNARAIYEADPYLEYVTLEETGDATEPGGDFWTTPHYLSSEEGQEYEWTLEKEFYYWYIVHPRLDYETPYYIDPATYDVSDPPDGVLWRDYLLYSSEVSFDYRQHWLVMEPLQVDSDDLAPLASLGSITAPDVDPIVILEDASGEPVLVESDIGTGRLLASTVLFEEAWTAGEEALLTNLDGYGNGNVNIHAATEVVCLADELPWGDNPVLVNLEDSGLGCDPVGSADLASLDLELVDKLIVLGQQPRELYEALVAISEDLETWISGGGTLQVHAASYEDITDLVFPGGWSVTSAASTELTFVGHPLLSETLEGTAALWDGEQYSGLSGGRPLDAGSCALDKVGWWASQNLFDNISERSAKHFQDYERAVYPQRIIHNHYGNCGECADLLGAGSRSALIAQRQPSSAEDHTWNEVQHEGAWIPYQISWSDSSTHIDYPNIGYDEQYGGSKTLSGIYAMRGDGYNTNMIQTYSDSVTLEVLVTDANDTPIDGAEILVATESFYDSEVLTIAQVAYTGTDGFAEIPMGEARNYWIWVLAHLGDNGWIGWPNADPEQLYVEKVVNEWDGAEVGATFPIDVVLEGVFELPAILEDDATGSGSLQVSGSVVDSFSTGEDLVAFYDTQPLHSYGHFLREMAPTHLTLALVTQAELDALEQGEDFAAFEHRSWEQLPFDDMLEGLPDEPLWLLAYNRSSSQVHVVSLGVQPGEDPDESDDDDTGDDDDDQGCECATTSRGGSWSSLLLVGLAAALLLRHRGAR